MGKTASKLTQNQWMWLEHADIHTTISAGPAGASSCASLVRRGLLSDMYRGLYRITQAGRDALTERSANAPAFGGLKVVTSEGRP